MFLKKYTRVSYFHSDIDEQQELVERGKYANFLLMNTSLIFESIHFK